MTDRTIVIAGLGLIGGSLAHDLSAAGARVLGYDANAASCAAALEAGVIHGIVGDDVASNPRADALVLAVPVDRAPALLERLAPQLPGLTLITDTGSTKRSIMSAAERLGFGAQFVGAHPLAGDHRGGWSAARSGLFTGARVFLCAAPTATPAARDLAERLWISAGARPEPIGAEAHDRLLAWISHLPQLLASAGATTLAGDGIAHDQLGPGGRDTLRLAGSNAELWTAIALDNGEYVAETLAALRTRIAELERAVRDRDGAALRGILEAAAAWQHGTSRGGPAVL